MGDRIERVLVSPQSKYRVVVRGRVPPSAYVNVCISDTESIGVDCIAWCGRRVRVAAGGYRRRECIV